MQERKQQREVELSKEMQQAKPSKGSEMIARSNQQLAGTRFDDRQVW